jgi:dolichol-phosphate mannosyltransferase
MERKCVSVIIPIYNETGNIEYLVSELNKNFNAVTGFDVELILVDDGSKDDSFDKLSRQTFGNYSVQLIKLSRNYGALAAVRAGVLKSKGDYITNLTADLQDPPDLPVRLFDTITQGYDVVWARRRTTKSGTFEKLFSKFYANLMRRYAFKDFPTKGLDITMFSAKVRANLNNNIEPHTSVQLQILSYGFKSAEIEYDKRERKWGKSKWTLEKKIKLLIDSFVAYSYAPIRFVTIMGFSFFILGSMWSVYLIIRKLIWNDLASGWPALISILMIGFGITNISLGIIAEYLWRTLDASRRRPPFIIDELIEIN